MRDAVPRCIRSVFLVPPRAWPACPLVPWRGRLCRCAAHPSRGRTAASPDPGRRGAGGRQEQYRQGLGRYGASCSAICGCRCVCTSLHAPSYLCMRARSRLCALRIALPRAHQRHVIHKTQALWSVLRCITVFALLRTYCPSTYSRATCSACRLDRSAPPHAKGTQIPGELDGGCNLGRVAQARKAQEIPLPRRSLVSRQLGNDGC